MTSGRAISHSEESPRPHARYLHGAQLWVALLDAHRHTAPAFEHHPDLPVVTARGVRATVILGAPDAATSPGTIHTPLVGADLALTDGTDLALPLVPEFEYAVLAMTGRIDVDGAPVEPGSMLYLGCGRRQLPAVQRSATEQQAVMQGRDQRRLGPTFVAEVQLVSRSGCQDVVRHA